MLAGRPVGLLCPTSNCTGEIVYNGNYFCSNFGQTCDWALSNGDNGEPVGAADRRTWKLIQETDWFRQATKERLGEG